jgi:AcrR family transcriptional regulator
MDRQRDDSSDLDSDQAPPSQPAAPPPVVRALRADARRNRARVLKAARERFAEDGLDAQMDGIGRAAGVGVGTVYRHLPTKEDLVEALITDRFERLAEWTQEALEEDESWEAFRRVMHRSPELQARDRALSEAMASRPQKMRQAAIDSGLYAPTEELIAHAQASGGMRSDAVTEDVPAIICGIGRVTQAGADGKTISWERFLAILLDGLQPGPGCSELPPHGFSVGRAERDERIVGPPAFPGIQDRLTAAAGATMTATVRSPFVSGTVVVVLAAIAAVGLEAAGAEPYSLVWLAALIVVMVLASLTDPVRFGWRDPDVPRRSR